MFWGRKLHKAVNKNGIACEKVQCFSFRRGKWFMSFLQGCFSLQKCNARFAGLERRERASMAFRPVSQDTSDWGKVEVLGTGYGLFFPLCMGISLILAVWFFIFE